MKDLPRLVDQIGGIYARHRETGRSQPQQVGRLWPRPAEAVAAENGYLYIAEDFRQQFDQFSGFHTNSRMCLRLQFPKSNASKMTLTPVDP